MERGTSGTEVEKKLVLSIVLWGTANLLTKGIALRALGIAEMDSSASNWVVSNS